MFIKAILEYIIKAEGGTTSKQTSNDESKMDLPSLATKKMLDLANQMESDGKTFLSATYVCFGKPFMCGFISSTDPGILKYAQNGGAITVIYMQKYETEAGFIVDNYHSKYYYIGEDSSINEKFTYNHHEWTISIEEGYPGYGYTHFHSFIISKQRTYICQTPFFLVDTQLFCFFINFINMVNEETTAEDVKNLVNKWNNETGFADYMRLLMKGGKDNNSNS